MRPCSEVTCGPGASSLVRLWTVSERMASREPTPLSVEELWQISGWGRPSHELLGAQVASHVQVQQMSRELGRVYASSKVRPQQQPARVKPRILPVRWGGLGVFQYGRLRHPRPRRNCVRRRICSGAEVAGQCWRLQAV